MKLGLQSGNYLHILKVRQIFKNTFYTKKKVIYRQIIIMQILTVLISYIVTTHKDKYLELFISKFCYIVVIISVNQLILTYVFILLRYAGPVENDNQFLLSMMMVVIMAAFSRLNY